MAASSLGVPRLSSGAPDGRTASDNAAIVPAAAIPANLSAISTRTQGTDWDTYQRITEGNTDVIQTIDFVVSPDTVGPGSDIVVLADTITIRGAVRTPGCNIWLCARNITFEPGASIDCSGLPGATYPSRAQDGSVPGSLGSSGADGQSGGAGGAVTINCKRILGLSQVTSNGGAGGPGQTGGTGGIGITGPRGRDARFNAGNAEPPGNGGIGYQGGTGGQGGRGGAGGNAGLISIYTVVTIAQSPQLSAAGGQPGAAGAPGDGGQGGPGGPPGNNHFFRPGIGRPGHGSPGGDEWFPPANPGPQGPKGAAAAPQTNVLAPGSNVDPVVKSGDMPLIAQWAALTQCRMLVLNTELAYLNRNTTDLDDQMQWIIRIAERPDAGTSLTVLRAKWIAPLTLPPAGPNDWAAIRGSALTLQSNFRMGLDPFGYAPTYVSSLTSDFLKAQAQQYLATALNVEKYYDQFFAQNQTNDNKVIALSSAIANLATDIQSRTAEAQSQGQYADSVQDEIDKLSLQVATLQRDIETAATAFQNALPHVGNCSFSNLVKFVVSVVAIANGMYAGFTGLVDAIGKIDALPADTDLITKVKFISDTFSQSDIASNFAKMQNGFQEMKDSLATNNAKIVVSLESFEKQLAPFEELPEARAYRDLLRAFVSSTQARNQKQVDYTQARLKSIALTAQVAQLVAESNRAKTTLQQTANPALNDEVIFLSSYLRASKLWILELFDLVRRSLTYATLSPIAGDYRALRVIDLQKHYDELNQEWIRRLNDQNGEMQTFSADFVLDLNAIPELQQQLIQNRSLAFSIPVDYPTFNRGGTSFVTVTEVSLALAGIRSTSNKFTASLVHQGNPTLVNTAGALMNFTHKSRQTNLLYNFTGGKWVAIASTAGNLRGSVDKFLFLSPFATWRFTVDQDTQVNWSAVKQLTFTFKGQFVPRTTHTQERMFRLNNQMMLKFQSLVSHPRT